MIAGYEGEGAAEEREEERTEGGKEGWLVGLVHVLGQPSEVRWRAAWEAVAGTAGVGGAGLEWAEVEARVRAAERAAMRTVQPAVTVRAGPVRWAGAPGTGRSVKVWTEHDVAKAVARGGEVDLRGTEVELISVVVVVASGTVATIFNGTLQVSSANAWLGNGCALAAFSGGELRLEDVRVVGTGMCCAEGGRLTLVDTHVTDAPTIVVTCGGLGSKAVVQGGSLVRSKAGNGVLCIDSGQVS